MASYELFKESNSLKRNQQEAFLTSIEQTVKFTTFVGCVCTVGLYRYRIWVVDKYTVVHVSYGVQHKFRKQMIILY